jgi:hypothetical protein
MLIEYQCGEIAIWFEYPCAFSSQWADQNVLDQKNGRATSGAFLAGA